MRLEGKTAIIVGAGQSPGETLGNGRATALRFAQEGAKIMAIDHDVASAEETASMVRKEGGDCFAFEADVTRSDTLAAAVATAHKHWGKIDILHYNVGVSLGGGDTTLLDFTEETFDRCAAINLRGAIMSCKYIIPIMRQQHSGAIIMISSFAVIENNPLVAYKVTKAGMNAFIRQVAIDNAEWGIRANVIMPGLMDTPMAVDTRVRVLGKTRAEVAAERDARVPLRHKMGTAWDVANAALFLASDEANHITGVELLVDGGRSLMVG
jgi:NAD(P)-dependent dehydrogenase (short-subunit alcohol dehydrogenase family)